MNKIVFKIKPKPRQQRAPQKTEANTAKLAAHWKFAKQLQM